MLDVASHTVRMKLKPSIFPHHPTYNNRMTPPNHYSFYPFEMGLVEADKGSHESDLVILNDPLGGDCATSMDLDMMMASLWLSNTIFTYMQWSISPTIAKDIRQRWVQNDSSTSRSINKTSRLSAIDPINISRYKFLSKLDTLYQTTRTLVI